MSILIPSGARKKVIPIIHQDNVRNIKLKLVPALATTTTSNAIRLNGVLTTVITPRPVPCRPLLTDNVRTASLITNNVKRTGRGPAVKPVMSTPVLRGVCMQLQTGVLMINLSVSAVPLRPRPVVPAITKLLVTRPAALPVPIPAVIPVIAVVPTNVPAGLKTTLVPMPARLSAVRLAVTAKTVLPEAAITQVHTPVLPSAEAVITAPIPAVPDRSQYLVLQIIIKYASLQLNAGRDVIPANITPIVTLLLNRALTAVLPQTLAVSALPASLLRRLRLIRGLM